jgi:hypothetical protein
MQTVQDFNLMGIARAPLSVAAAAAIVAAERNTHARCTGGANDTTSASCAGRPQTGYP